MRRALNWLSAAWVLAIMLSLPHMTFAAGLFKVSEPSLCLDGMETVPFEDDLMPIEISVDGGCMLSETPISI
jgi:hypothetical protein